MAKKLAAFVKSERAINEMVAHASGGVGNVGPSPAPYDPIPDYADIYYQPEGDPRKEDEEAANTVRRRTMAKDNRGKYGFHGTADVTNEPMLRYESDDFPQQDDRREDNMRHEKPNIPGEYEPGGGAEEEADDEEDDEVEQQRARIKKRPRTPVTKGPMPKLMMPVGKFSNR